MRREPKRTSRATMEMHQETQRPNNNGQLISVPHKDTIRLLEVYVKRSLSLNDGVLWGEDKRAAVMEKWVTMPKRRQRRHSSDPLLHLANEQSDGDVGTFPVVTPLSTETEKPAKKPKKKKRKKPSLWKSFLGIFSRRSSEEREEEADGPALEMPAAAAATSSSEADEDAATTCLPATPVIAQKKKSMRRRSIRRRFSKRRLSLTRISRSGKDLIPADITRVEAVVNDIQPTDDYYLKVSEELEKIVHEVKEKEEVEPLSDEDVINRIIALTKEEGDAIDGKLRDNPTLSNFFQGMSYSSFQRLADEYLQTEASPAHNPPTVLPTAPELVKLAFTLDFTARIAGLSKQNVGHITGLGNRYLQDRFEYQQACSDHPGSDSDN